jgi:4-hydroxybutyryl-CoA dehydratase / vinylacetyl-CoA-Delta-isomerase
MLMSSEQYRESLRERKPTVYLNGKLVSSVADEPLLEPGVNAIGLTYDFALNKDFSQWMAATEQSSGEVVNRFMHINRSSQDLLDKLEAVRVVCQYSGCAQRYLGQDGLNAIYETVHRVDAEHNTEYGQRFMHYLHEVQKNDISLGLAMTDGKGDRKKRPSEQSNKKSYVHISERRADGIVISGAKSIVTGAPYVHEFLVLPCRKMNEEDKDFAVCCAVPIDAKGLTIITRPAGRPGNESAKFSAKFAQSVGVVVFEDVFVPWEKVFLAGEYEHSQHLTTSFAAHHRHSCIGARAGFGDLLIGAGNLMADANGVQIAKTPHLKDRMVELIKIVEGFYACGVASCVYGEEDKAGNYRPEKVFANIGKLLLANQIYDMHRVAHEVSGGMIVGLPGPEEDHNPATSATLAEIFRGSDDVTYQHRAQVARFIEDITASETGGWYSVISLHGGGSPAAMETEIMRNYPVRDRSELVQQLIDRDVLDIGQGPSRETQPGKCCAPGCVGSEKIIKKNDQD